MELCTGLDIGTNTIIAARNNNEGKINFKRQRDAFFEIKTVTDFNANAVKKSLESRKIDFVKKNNSFFIVGENAIIVANERGKNVRRPMHKGIISAMEKESHPMIKMLIQNVLGKARRENERLIYSVPAEPIEGEFDAIYHKGMMKMFLNELGYECDSILEAEAIIYSELLDEGLTGIAFSFGAGMVNICMMNLGEHLAAFSIPKSGDWIDHSIAVALNLTDSLAQAEKEAGINLKDPKTKVEQAAALYYHNLLEYVISVLAYKLERVDIPSSSEGYPIVLAGGGSIAEGFEDVFKDILAKADLPFKVSGVKPAKDKMNVVANGCLMAAIM